ncbi:MAG: hypothetical protein ACLFQV_11035, partial [Vulcanimicrobiota bacterium]
WKIQGEVEKMNNALSKIDKEDVDNFGYSDCLFLIPGQGCILEEFRPHVCVTAFRNCFKQLQLYDFVDANIFEVNEEDLYKYFRADFEISRKVTRPKIVIGASENFRKKTEKYFPNRGLGHIEELSYYELALLADFIVLPFSTLPGDMQGKINRAEFYLFNKIKDSPPVTFIEKLERGTSNNKFDFGLDYCQLFKIV